MRVQEGHHLIPLSNGLPSHCEVYGHFWQATNRTGRYQCANCRAFGYCSACLLTVPQDAIVMRCGKHREEQAHA